METENLYEAIRRDFFRKVYSGEIEPDQLLIPERRQAEELSVSRGTVRKARQLLVEEGFIANRQGQRRRLYAFSTADYSRNGDRRRYCAGA